MNTNQGNDVGIFWNEDDLNNTAIEVLEDEIKELNNKIAYTQIGNNIRSNNNLDTEIIKCTESDDLVDDPRKKISRLNKIIFRLKCKLQNLIKNYEASTDTEHKEYRTETKKDHLGKRKLDTENEPEQFNNDDITDDGSPKILKISKKIGELPQLIKCDEKLMIHPTELYINSTNQKLHQPK